MLERLLLVSVSPSPLVPVPPPLHAFLLPTSPPLAFQLPPSFSSTFLPPSERVFALSLPSSVFGFRVYVVGR